MMGFSLGHLLVLGVVLLIFGPKRIPELASGIGKAIRSFKSALDDQEVNQKPQVTQNSTETGQKA